MKTDWPARLKAEVPLDERAEFLADLQALVASVRNGLPPVVTDLVRRHAELAIAYMDDGDKKERARKALRNL